MERVTDYAEEKEIQSSNLETVRLTWSLYERVENGIVEADPFAA